MACNNGVVVRVSGTSREETESIRAALWNGSKGTDSIQQSRAKLVGASDMIHYDLNRAQSSLECSSCAVPRIHQ